MKRKKESIQERRRKIVGAKREQKGGDGEDQYGRRVTDFADTGKEDKCSKGGD